MDRLICDIETRSGLDISKAGSYKYAQDGEYEILLIAWKFNNEETRIFDLKLGGYDPLEWMAFLKMLEDPRVIKYAYNAEFEWWCLNMAGFKTPLAQWRDTQAHAMYLSYPASLEACGKAVKLPEAQLKMMGGKALIRYFCTPQKPTKKNGGRRWNEPTDDPAKWEDFKKYCVQDVDTEYQIQIRLDPFEVPESEWNLWRQTVAMNALGVRTDAALVQGALSVNADSVADLMQEAQTITGLDNPNSTSQLLVWLADNGCQMSNLTKEAVKETLDTHLSYNVRRVLELRQQLSKTSIKKYETMQDMLCGDYRIRGLTKYYGARTGRFSGRGVQLQNLTKHRIKSVDVALGLIREGNYPAIQAVYGSAPDLLSQVVRMCFIPSEGRKLVVADFSAIEARVIAWLAGERWVNEVFATHGKIYEATAAQMFHVPIETIAKGEANYDMRSKGKVATLALGYNGGPNALIAMGALHMGIEEKDLPDIVTRWRTANPNIVQLWRDMEQAAVDTVHTGRAHHVRGGQVVFNLESDPLFGQTYLTMTLPSGRKIYYARPFIKENRFGKGAVHYYEVNVQKKWTETSTYGGRIVENCVQSIARDCLVESINRIQAKGWDIVFHVHDEVVLDAPMDVTVEEVCELMSEPISWAPGLILKAAGFESQYYMKD